MTAAQFVTRKPGVGYTLEANALFARMTSPPSSARRQQINTLIKALKVAGIWDKLDGLWLMAAADSQAASLNWISSSFTLLPVSSPTFVADKGYTGNGTSSYLNTQLSLASAVQYQQNSAHLAVWPLTSTATGANDIGANSGTNSELAQSFAGTTYYAINNASGADGTFATAGTSGLFIVTRTAAMQAAAYKNGAVVSTDTGNVSAARVAQNVYIGALNNAGTAANFSDRQEAMASVGAGLSATEVTAYYNAVLAYMNAVGAV